MSDIFYPTVDIQFLETQIIASGRVIPQSKIHVGSTTTFMLIGTQAFYKRLILIRELTPNQVSYEQASGLAIRIGFIGNLMDWLEKNKNWKEGAYIVPQSTPIVS